MKKKVAEETSEKEKNSHHGLNKDASSSKKNALVNNKRAANTKCMHEKEMNDNKRKEAVKDFKNLGDQLNCIYDQSWHTGGTSGG